MNHIPTFEDFINEQNSLNEGISALILAGLVATGVVSLKELPKGPWFPNPMEIWKDYKNDKILKSAIDKLSKDEEIIDFLKLPYREQVKGWDNLVKSKLNDRERDHLKKISIFDVRTKAGLD
jgi:hypothetical protein